MGIIEILMGIVICILAVLIISVVYMQEHKAKMGALTGASDESSFGRNMGKTTDAMLSRATKTLTIVFFVAIVLLGAIQKFMA